VTGGSGHGDLGSVIPWIRISRPSDLTIDPAFHDRFVPIILIIVNSRSVQYARCKKLCFSILETFMYYII
jgi:hypothetical protein